MFVLLIFNLKNFKAKKSISKNLDSIFDWIKQLNSSLNSISISYLMSFLIKLKFFGFRFWNRIFRKLLDKIFKFYISTKLWKLFYKKYLTFSDLFKPSYWKHLFLWGVSPSIGGFDKQVFLEIFHKTIIISGKVISPNIVL